MHCYPRFEVRKHNRFRSSAKFPGDEGKTRLASWILLYFLCKTGARNGCQNVVSSLLYATRVAIRSVALYCTNW